MKTDKRYKLWRVFWVIFAWYIFLGLLGLITLLITPEIGEQKEIQKLFTWKILLNQCISLIFSVFYYYFSLNIFYRLFAQRKSSLSFLKPVLIAFFIICTYYVITNFALKTSAIGINVGNGKTITEIPVLLMLFAYVLGAVFYIGASLLIAYLTYLRDEKKQRKILEEQKMQLEVEKSTANLNFLKAQINPHFLHNTLNFLYAKSLPYSTELSEGILTLSDIMRYALSEGNAKDGKAPLKDEIEHVRNVIKIQQLRFSNKINMQFEVEGVINGATIIPFVLITLVENAFKHGDLKSNENPIIIKAVVEGNKLYFYCRNKKKSGPKELSTGIGLNNIKKRLDLAYGNNYNFTVKDDEDFYTTELTINQL